MSDDEIKGRIAHVEDNLQREIDSLQTEIGELRQIMYKAADAIKAIYNLTNALKDNFGN